MFDINITINSTIWSEVYENNTVIREHYNTFVIVYLLFSTPLKNLEEEPNSLTQRWGIYCADSLRRLHIWRKAYLFRAAKTEFLRFDDVYFSIAVIVTPSSFDVALKLSIAIVEVDLVKDTSCCGDLHFKYS